MSGAFFSSARRKFTRAAKKLTYIVFHVQKLSLPTYIVQLINLYINVLKPKKKHFAKMKREQKKNAT